MMTDRLISEQAVMESLTKEYNQKRTGDWLKLAWIEKAVSATPTASDWDRYSTKLWKEAYERGKRDAQPEVAKDTNVPSTDCISRQAAIDAMSEALKRVFPEHRQIVEKCLNRLPSAQPEPSQVARDIATIMENEQDMRVILAQPHWIPVSERLPEEDLTDVLLLYHDKRCGCENDYYIMQAYTVRGQWRPALRIDDSDMDGLEPVAWMPLPEPYKED